MCRIALAYTRNSGKIMKQWSPRYEDHPIRKSEEQGQQYLPSGDTWQAENPLVNSVCSLKKMGGMFHRYVSLPEGNNHNFHMAPLLGLTHTRPNNPEPSN